jgi:hypothetical protein
MGVPTVAVNTHVFARVAKATALAHGMPTARNVYVPQPVVGRTEAELRAYIYGTDPSAALHAGASKLTKPLTRGLKGASFQAPRRFLEPTPRTTCGSSSRTSDGLPADHPADRGARRADGESTKHAADVGACGPRPSAVLGVRRREGGIEYHNARRAARYLPSSRDGGSSTTARSSSTTSFAAVSWSTGRSATRSA